MDQVKYYCQFCNKNINIKKGKVLRCSDCGYFLISSKLAPKEIIKKKIELTTYCAHCDKIILSIPVKTLIDAFSQRSAWEIQNLRNNHAIRDGKKLSEREKELTMYVLNATKK